MQATEGQQYSSKTHKQLFGGLSRDWEGGKNVFTCFWGSFLVGEKKPQQNPLKIPGQSRAHDMFMFFSSSVGFSLSSNSCCKEILA